MLPIHSKLPQELLEEAIWARYDGKVEESHQLMADFSNQCTTEAEAFIEGILERLNGKDA